MCDQHFGGVAKKICTSHSMLKNIFGLLEQIICSSDPKIFNIATLNDSCMHV